MSKSKLILLDDFSLGPITVYMLSFSAPEIRSIRFLGKVFGHPNFANGEMVYISHALDVRKIGKHLIITTCRRKYRLGTPNAEYLAANPGWVDQIVKLIKEIRLSLVPSKKAS